VAEGVESEMILQTLIEMGCDVGQGYFWSKAVSAAEAAQWL
jgi:EAL domain-containing protein (putative c-di-GMP-specific phosphodiesterase class I)